MTVRPGLAGLAGLALVVAALAGCGSDDKATASQKTSPAAAAAQTLSLVVVGATAWFRLGVDRFPAVDLPTVLIRTTLSGASTEEVEILVSQPIEEAVNSVQGIEELRSISAAGSSIVIVTFGLDRDIDVATQDVRDRVAAVLKRLPPEADRLAAYQLPITAVRDALARQNTDLPGGSVTGAKREHSLRTLGRLADARAFDAVVVARIDGRPVRIDDLGWAEDGTREMRSVARLNGVPAVVLEVRRQSGSG